MGSTTFILVCAAEVVAVLLLIIAVLIVKNRNLHHLMHKLKARAEEIRAKLKELTSQSAPPPEPLNTQESYRDKLNHQLELTKNHHRELSNQQDIALDLDPEAPTQRRTAALRNAFLVAEKEASPSTGETDEINWDLLSSRYQQLLDFNTDYSQQASDPSEDIEAYKEEITQQKKRIDNLSRFKSMYFDLENQWNKCKEKADNHYVELKSISVSGDQQEAFTLALDRYQSSYHDINQLIENGPTNEAPQQTAIRVDGQAQELTRLRSVAADQHRIINELKGKLDNAENSEEQLHIMSIMQEELQKQARFLQESETCIQLMDNELNTANRELEALRDQSKELPQLKAALKELIASADTHEQTTESLKHENKRLTHKLSLAEENQQGGGDDLRLLRKELSTLQANYNDLEERFLDLKLKD